MISYGYEIIADFIVLSSIIIAGIYGDGYDFSYIRRTINDHYLVVFALLLAVLGLTFSFLAIGLLPCPSFIDRKDEYWKAMFIGVSGNFFCSILTVTFVKFYIDDVDVKKKNERELTKLIRFSRVADILLKKYIFYYNILVTPIDVKNDHVIGNKLREDFNFSDLRDCYVMTLLVTDELTQPRIERFFKKEEDLANYFQKMLVNIDFEFFPEIREVLFKFVGVVLSFDNRNVIISNYKVQFGDGKCLKDFISEYIANETKDWVSMMDRGELQGNVLIPYVMLYKALKEEALLINQYLCLIEEYRIKE